MAMSFTSQELRSLYQKNERDEAIYELTDYAGLQIVRKYANADLSDRRMFIKFVIIPHEEIPYVYGGVDMVKERGTDTDGWTIVFSEKGLLKRPTNYSFHKSEEITFNQARRKVIFRGSEYSICEFIDLLEQNHLRDMFLLSRIKSFFIIARLRMLFTFADSTFDKYDQLFKRDSVTTSLKSPSIEVVLKEDPLFQYFRIYKNMIGIYFALLLVPVFLFSIILRPEYYSATNPFIIISALLVFFGLEKASEQLNYTLQNTDFVRKKTISALELKGTLKKYKLHGVARSLVSENRLNELFRFRMLAYFAGVFMLAIAAYAIQVLVSQYVFSTTIVQISLLSIFIAYCLVAIFSYLFSKRLRVFLRTRPEVLTILSLIIPLLLVSLQMSSQIMSESIAAENALKQANDQNYKFAAKIEENLKANFDNYPVFTFDTEIYNKYYSYVTSNYSFECKNTYFKLILMLNQQNLLIDQKKEVDLAQLQLTTYTQMKKYQSAVDINYRQQQHLLVDIVPLLSYAMKNCQDFRQRR